MARDLGNPISTLKIRDNLSGSEIHLYYRQPTTQERSGYQNEAIQRKGRNIVFRQAEARQKYGLKILTGFREGDFTIDGRPIASGTESPHHHPEWKTLVADHAADLVQLLAAHVFDAPAEVEETEAEETEAGEDAEGN